MARSGGVAESDTPLLSMQQMYLVEWVYASCNDEYPESAFIHCDNGRHVNRAMNACRL